MILFALSLLAFWLLPAVMWLALALSLISFFIWPAKGFLGLLRIALTAWIGWQTYQSYKAKVINDRMREEATKFLGTG